jgi:hypothetical protein
MRCNVVSKVVYNFHNNHNRTNFVMYQKHFHVIFKPKYSYVFHVVKLLTYLAAQITLLRTRSH